MLKNLDLREWLVLHQSHCPGCGKRVTIHDHLHHVFIRRNPDIPELYCELNMALVCPSCHVPEAPDLNYECALQKWAMGFTPQQVREWVAGLPYKVKPGMPLFFVRAEEDFYADNVF